MSGNDMVLCPVCGKTKGRAHIRYCRRKAERRHAWAESHREEAISGPLDSAERRGTHGFGVPPVHVPPIQDVR